MFSACCAIIHLLLALALGLHLQVGWGGVSLGAGVAVDALGLDAIFFANAAAMARDT